MAGTPRHFSGSGYSRGCRLVLCLLALGLSGCEVGRTMFEYNSGGMPFMGVDLIPRKKSPTKISHQPATGAERDNKQNKAGVHLMGNDQPDASRFQKKPLRLNLPSSREVAVEEVAETETDDLNLAAEEPPFREPQF